MERAKPSRFTMTRRSFLKTAAITGAAASLAGTSAMTALADSDTVEQTSTEVKRIRTACRGCGKMECGVWVTVENGRAVKIEGDDSAWQSNGNCCTKSQASLQAAYHPDRLRYPMIRTNPKGSDDPGWKRATYDEAFAAIINGMNDVVDKYTNKGFVSIEGTSRLYASSCSRAYRDLFDGLNSAAATQICKGPRRETGAMTIENGIHWQAVVDYPKVYVQWGTDQTQSNYDEACRTTVEAAQRAEIFISIDPRVSNCGHSADYHLPLRPATDLALALGWTRIVIDRELYDDFIVKYYSNAPFLVCDDIEPSGWIGVKGNISAKFPVNTRLLKESDIVEGGDVHKFMVWNNATGKLAWFNADEGAEKPGLWEGQTDYNIPTTGWEYERGGWVPDYPEPPEGIDPALWCEDPDGFTVTLKDGRQVKCKTVWQRYWDDCVSEWTLEKTAETCDLDPKLIEDACLAWATRIDPRCGNGGLNAQLAPEQTGRSTQTFRAIYLLFFMTGNYDEPGGNRGMTRNRCASAIPPYTASKYSTQSALSFTEGKYAGTEESEMEKRKDIVGGDKFPLTKWWNTWCDSTSIWETCHTGEPYPIKAGTCGAGDFMNNSNAMYAWEAIMDFDFFFVVDLWHTPGSRLADVILPANHWLECTGWLRQSQGSSGAFGANVPCIEPPSGVYYEPDLVKNLYKAAGRPFFDPEEGDPWDRPFTDALDKHVANMGMFDSWEEFKEEFQKHGWWQSKDVYPEDWGTYRRYMMGYLRNGKGGNKALMYDGIPGTSLPTMKVEFWSTIMESLVPGANAELPVYDEPPMSPVSTPELFEDYPLIMTTGRRIPVYFHNEHRQLPWCREIWPAPRVEINPADAAAAGIAQGDWVWIESAWGKVRQCADLFHGVKPGVINCEHQWWFPELNDATKGFDLCNINNINNKNAQDPYCGSCQVRGIPVKIYKATAENSPFGNPVPCGADGTEIIHDASDPRLKQWKKACDKIAADPSLGESFSDLHQDSNKWEVFSS
ncbi:molybdopterin-dependent oxidoreductase [Adlercreutzia sp. ZJ138]|uniref:molybdopterin-containing oxidoreductase family protein n=1 Tax=Adlercreutzia sp. ZJ138 TaxID=2709405 RepID=UPI0013EC4BB2|nr:molybdopterin-dependent oxidoreductase [Adlercreutzia sp. ZJ138]